MRGNIFTCLILSLFVTFGKAQILTGGIYNKQGTPIAYANVIVCQLADSSFVNGCISEEDGIFSLSLPENKEYILKVSYIGYKNATKRCISGDIGRIILEADAVTLGEIEVKGQLPTFRMKGSSLLTNVQHSLLSTVGTANDVLKRIPGIIGGEGEFMVFGKGAPLIYINNREVKDNSELAQLSSNDIAEVELITNPGAEYDATVQAVLKLKTVKRKGDGVSGYVSAYGSEGLHFSNREQLNLNYRKNGFDLFGSAAYVSNRQEQEQHSEQHTCLDTLWRSRTAMESLTHRKTLNTQLGMNYEIGKNQSAGFRYDYTHIDATFRTSSSSDYFADAALFDALITENRQPLQHKKHRLNAYYTASFSDRWLIDFNFDHLTGRNERKQEINETSRESTDRTLHTNNLTKDHLYAYKLILGYVASSLEIKLGHEFSFISQKNNYLNTEGTLPSSANRIKDRKAAAFASVAYSFDRFSLDAGLRYEHAVYDYYEGEVFMPEQSRVYDRVYPDLSVSYDLKPVQLSLTYSEKTRRPYFYQLRNDIQYNDRFSYETGNPALQPQIQRYLNFRVGYRDLLFNVGYSHIKDYIAFTTKPYPDDQRITLFWVKNYPKLEALNLMLSYSPKWGIWEPSFTIYLDKPYFSMDRSLGKLTLNKPSGTFYFENMWRLPAGFVLSLDMDYATAGNWDVYYNRPQGGVDLGLRRSFLKNMLDVNLQGFDLFKTRRTSNVMYGEAADFSRWNYSDRRQVRLTVTYRFNATRSKYKGTGAAKEEINRL